MNKKEEQEFINQIYNYATKQLVEFDKTPEEVKQELTSEGISEQDAKYVVDNIVKQIKEAKHERAKKDMTYGGLWFLGGTIVTAATYGAASNGGGFVIAWGAIIFGAIQFLKGLFNRTS